MKRKVWDTPRKIIRAIKEPGQSDLPNPFDVFLAFVAKYPKTATAENFFYFHGIELEGRDDFLYMIGKKFVLREWVELEDRENFFRFWEERSDSPMAGEVED